MKAMIFILGLGMIVAVSGFELKAHYGKNDDHYVFYDVMRAISLKCSTDESADIVWYKNDTKVEKITDLKDRYTVTTGDGKKESIFKIVKGLQRDSGQYSCQAKGKTKTFQVAGNVFVKVPSNVNTVEGETLKLVCNTVGTGVTVTWFLPDNSTIDEDGDHVDERISVESSGDAHNNILVIEGVKKSERGVYICEGRHNKEVPSDLVVTSTTYIRVKDKLAALWPFIGICSEVFILCAIIVIYEKRKAKIPDDLDESDTDQNQGSKSHRK